MGLLNKNDKLCVMIKRQ